MASSPSSVPSGVSDVKLAEIPRFFQKLQLKKIPSGFMAMISRYQHKYILCKNGKMTTFFHAVGLCIIINYWVEYKHLKRRFLSKVTVFHVFILR